MSINELTLLSSRVIFLFTQWTRRKGMGEKRSSRWIALGAAGGGALLILIVSAFFLGRDVAPASSPLATPPVSALSGLPVAVVDGKEIGYDVWREAVLVDRVMSRLAGMEPPTLRQTLDRLVNQLIVLRATQPVSPIIEGEVEGYLTALKAGWGVDDVVISAALAEAGLDRAALVRAVAQSLEVERRQDALRDSGNSMPAWLSQQRAASDIAIYEERMTIDGLGDLDRSLAALVGLASSQTPTPPSFLSGLPTPVSVLPTPSFIPPTAPALANWPPVLPENAPDFTLRRVIGVELTLSDQLAEGPVVLVFFQKCG
jgi:hypothetical protein